MDVLLGSSLIMLLSAFFKDNIAVGVVSLAVSSYLLYSMLKECVFKRQSVHIMCLVLPLSSLAR